MSNRPIGTRRRAKRAEQVFRADLAVNRRNPRSLEAAWSHADTHLRIADLF